MVIENTNIIIGSDNAEVLNGTEENDSIEGKGGDDTIHAYNGNDIIIAGLDNDIIHGGLGNDTYKFDDNWGQDVIYDLKGINSLDFSAIDQNSNFVNIDLNKAIVKQNAQVYHTLKFNSASPFLSVVQENGNYDLDNMSYENGTIKFIGREANDNLGMGLSSAGDINGDGYNDFIIGAPGENGSGIGEAYIVFGRNNLSWSGLINESSEFDLSNISEDSSIIRVMGADFSDNFGRNSNTIGNVQDLNNDGYNDIVISAYGGGNKVASGAAYIIFGRDAAGWSNLTDISGNLDLETITPEDNIKVITGKTKHDRLGYDVSFAGDINNDNFNDLIISAPLSDHTTGDWAVGETYLLLGRTSSEWDDLTNGSVSYDLSTLNNDINDLSDNIIQIRGKDSWDYAGRSISAGDINKDGYSDIIIGAPNVGLISQEGGNPKGEVYVILGRSDFADLTDNTNLFNLSNIGIKDNTFEFIGSDESGLLGESVSYAGDINNDGFGDMIIGSPGSGINGTKSGAAYLIFGSNDWIKGSYDIDNFQNRIKLIGESSNDNFGQSVNKAHDINADGYDDILIGAFKAEKNQSEDDQGKAYIILGRDADNWSNLSSNANFDMNQASQNTQMIRIIGQNKGDFLGYDLNGIGDINNDSYADISIGAIGAGSGGPNSGETFVLFGREKWYLSSKKIDTNIIGSQGNDSIIANSIDNIIDGQAGNDDLQGKGGNDTYKFNDNWGKDTVKDSNGLNSLDFSSVKNNNIYVDLKNSAVRQNNEYNHTVDLLDDLEYDLNVSELNNTVQFIGKGEEHLLGHFVSNAGDVNGDGIDDLVIGANQSYDTKTKPGEAYIVLGREKEEWNSLIGADGKFNTADSSWANNKVIRLIGKTNGERFGFKVANGGDLNGDSYDDIVVSADSDSTIDLKTGQTYIIFGRSDAEWNSFAAPTDGNFNMNNIDESSKIYSFLGNKYAGESGTSISNAGDIDADGYDDFLIGAGGYGYDNSFITGNIYLLFGRSESEWSTLVGDDNKFNLGEIENLSSDDGVIHFVGKPENFSALSRMSEKMGDINNDGIDDLLISAKYSDNLKGESYLFLGRSRSEWMSLTDQKNNYELINANKADEIYTFIGRDEDDVSGQGLSTAGDVNGDGLNDIIIGAESSNSDGFDSGEAYLIFGRSKEDLDSLTDQDGQFDLNNVSQSNGMIRFIGNGKQNDFGVIVTSAGDINNDGYNDIAVGAYQYAVPATNKPGEAYIIFGRPEEEWNALPDELYMSDLKSQDKVIRINGEEINSHFGYGLSTGGDVNNDGIDDVLVGASHTSENGDHSGKAYLLFGKENWLESETASATKSIVGSQQDDTITANNLDNTIDGQAGNDNISGEAGNDSIDGGLGQDTLNGGTGADTLLGGDDKDKLYGKDGNDSIDGGSGNDIIDGGAGIDTMNGGTGNDRYYVDNNGEVVIDSAGRDYVISSVNYTLPGGIEILELTGDAIIGTGNDLNNNIVGNSLDNILQGGEGKDKIYAKNGNDSLAGGDGDDYLNGGTGVDTMNGAAGNDRFVIDNINDVIIDDEGYDGVYSYIDYTLSDNIEKLCLRGNAVVAEGNNYDNWIEGSSKNNTLKGNKGDDYLAGNKGNDTYLFNTGDGKDRVFDKGNDTEDRVLFSTEIQKESIAFFDRGGYYLDLKYGEGDIISIQQYNNPKYAVENIEVSSGLSADINGIINHIAAYEDSNSVEFKNVDEVSEDTQLMQELQIYWI